MSTTTLLLLFLSVLVAGGLAYFQYIFRAKSRFKLNVFLAFLRFLGLFGILLLLINPIIKSVSYEIKKTNLPVFIDNSESIKDLKANNQVEEVLKVIESDNELKNKFDIQYFSFDSSVSNLDSLNFTGKQTQIDAIAREIKQLYRNEHFPVLLLTDGNQTIGNDYVYSFSENSKVYPIIVGDTTKILDCKINQINVNKYAFLKNKFPVEVFVQYNDQKSLPATVSINLNGTIVAKQSITFTNDKKAQNLNFLLDADKVGPKKYTVSISSSLEEKNTKNNAKPFVVEVIDQRTEVAIISAISHPDIGALKRSIESNLQRKVSVLKPSDIKNLNDFNVLVLYQPDASFKSVFEANKNSKRNAFIITGLATDFTFLNLNSNDFSFKMNNQKEDYLAVFNSGFNLFSLNDIGFEEFSPLESKFGTIKAKNNNTSLLNAKIRNTEIGQPFFAFLEEGNERKAYLFGEGIWKWRMDYYLEHKNFTEFDVFIDKTIQYLNSNASKQSLIVNTENFYNSGEPITITAEYFNKNYEFDRNANLEIKLINKETNIQKNYNFILAGNEYKVSLNGLDAGNYSFSVIEKNSNTTKSGTFEVLAFNIEKQFVNPDVDRLQQLASYTNGKLVFPNQLSIFLGDLKRDENYKPVEKEVVKQAPLIDWKWLLIIIVLVFSIEWFVRKYNGLI
ncbi:hypothetical protein [Flavobacterium okayamense]|uniref:VWA domain-containing protein n=1 Tax=Flavobacterium okayamense TaxID=2830782 RepID=A0ABM7S5M7_9FLAO|nr:hypothetical protein [Flavobacterium okayamense]BCY28807.1 hypothetical protein KK2020170_16750 [Flavobacterium okayamense]